MPNEQQSVLAPRTETSKLEHSSSFPRFSAGPGALWRSGLAVTVLVAYAIMALGQEPGEYEEAPLGAVQFEVSCSAEVSGDFDRAIALLHHMQYEESRDAFNGIVAADSMCGMAHWGIAVTLFQPLWPAPGGPGRPARCA